MGKQWRQLHYDDRLKIYAWLQAGWRPVDIAKRLKVTKSTIYREIKRGKFVKRNSDWTESEEYDPFVAEKKYQENLRKRGRSLKIGNDIEYAEYLEHKIIDDKYSPAAALVSAKNSEKNFNTSICVNTLYAYIKMGIFLTLTIDYLPIRKKRHKKAHVRTQKRAQAGDSISLRPKHINRRDEFGNWEMDTVVGPQGKSRKVMLVLTERKTRKEIIRLMDDKTARSVVKAIDGLERKYGTSNFRRIFKTITVDNGSEFSNVEGMEKSKRSKKKRTKIYFCHPYCSCERGSNENTNRLIRRHIPKGMNFDNKTRTEIQYIEDWINNYPRQIFGYKTAEELFRDQMKLLFPA